MTEDKNNPNMDLWDSFGSTDPKYVKKPTAQTKGLSTINPVYMVKAATEAFGPIGKGWGYDVIEDGFVNTEPAKMPAAPNEPAQYMTGPDGSLVWCQSHTVKLRLWYGSKDNYVEQYGHTPFRYNSKYGISVDTEYAKKSVTDAMKKCLSLLGICADVYMGEFENAEYVAGATIEHNIKKADDKTDAVQKAIADIEHIVKDHAKMIGKVPNAEGVEKIHGLAWDKVSRRCEALKMDQEEVNQIFWPVTEARNNRINELKGKQHASV